MITTHDGTATTPEVDVVSLCRGLVAADTQNPPGNEARAARIVTEILASAGFEIQRHDAEPGRANVVGRLRRGTGPRLIFQAHSDTKPAAPEGIQSSWSTDPFRAEERDGSLYGLGTCDTKGGLAAQLAAAHALAANPRWSGELLVQAVADEEDGSRLGAEHLLHLGLLDADGAIVAEPTGCAPSLAQLGNAWAEVTVTGRAAHAGHPERGDDAFQGARRYIAAIEGLLSQMRAPDAFPGHPRLNVGEFAMPGHPGTIPGQCRFRADIRVPPGIERDQVLALYDAAADQVRQAQHLSVQVTPYQGGGCQSHQIDPNHGLVHAFRAAQNSTSREHTTTSFAGGTDARYFAIAGTPAVVYGPGSLEQAHAADEFVPIEELKLAEQQLIVAALTFFQTSNR